jgi:adhesin/invasin
LAGAVPALAAVAEGQTTIFSDNFNRPNSDVLGPALVGGTWVEFSNGNNVIDADIVTNLLRFATNNVDNAPAVSNTFAARSSGILRWAFGLSWAQGLATETTYSLYLQIGNSAQLAPPPLDGVSVPGAAINLRWGDDNFGFTTEEGFGYVQGTSQTQVATLSGLHTIEVIANLDLGVFDLKLDGTTVATGVAFDKSMGTLGSLDAVRLYQNRGIEAAAGGAKAFDDILITHTNATKLGIGAINGGVSPRVGVPFSVVVESRDLGGSPAVVLTNTPVTLSLNSGSGTLGGTLTGTILAGTSSVTISGVTYDAAGSGVSLLASRTTGDPLSSGTSGAFTVVGPASPSTSTLSASPSTVPANGVATATVTVQLKDANGVNLPTGGDAVTLSTTLGTLSAVTDNGNGTYTATLSSTVGGSATVSGTVNAAAIVSTAGVTFTPAIPSPATSTITASPTSVPANGTSASTITVQLKDAGGGNLTSGGHAVTLATTLGTLSAVTDNGNGTYTATLTSTTTGSATVSGAVNAAPIVSTASVTFTSTAAVPSPATSTITASPASVPANGTSASTITVQLKDAGGNNISVGGHAVTLSTTLGTLSAVTDNGNGTYTATLTSTTTGSATVSGTVNAAPIVSTAGVTFTAVAVAPSPATSTISASPNTVLADGISVSTITVQLKDAGGNNITGGGPAVTLSTTLGTLSAVTDNGNGTYTATLRSTVAGAAVVSGTLNAAPIVSTAAVTFTTTPAVGLVFAVQPSTVVAGAAIAPPVQVVAVDGAGNPATAFQGNVIMSLATNPVGGTLSGTLTVQAVNGVATFPNLRIDRAGTGYVLNAASGSLTPAQSAPFEVLANNVDLEVTLQVSDLAPAPGDEVVFTVRVTNKGPRAATGVDIADELPGRVTFVSATPSQGTFDTAARVWRLGTLAANASATLVIRATVKDQP